MYTYDVLRRLDTVTDGTNTIEDYDYDANGNRTDSTTTGQGVRTYTYDVDDRLLGWDGSDPGTDYDVEYVYDRDGYLTTKTEGADVTTYDYSSRGELLEVVFPDNSSIEYVHRISGQRLARMKYDTLGVLQTSETEKYLWSGMTKLLAIYDGSDVLKTRFQYAGGRNPVAMVQGTDTYYLTYDQVGSLRAIYNDAGILQGEITYDSFGNELSNSLTGALLIPIGFAGGYSDRDTGLVRFGFRDYDPNVGRWTAKDPIFFGGGQINIYVYVNNNPVDYFDSIGLGRGDGYFSFTIFEGLWRWAADYNSNRKFNKHNKDRLNEIQSSQVAFDRAATPARKGAEVLASIGGTTYAGGVFFGGPIPGKLYTAGGRCVTKHGAERLLEDNLAGKVDDIMENPSLKLTQGKDGAEVFIRKNGKNDYDVIIDGADGIVTAMGGWSKKKVNKLAENYDWY